MSNYSRDDLDTKALRRLLSEEQLKALSDLVARASELLFDSIAGESCWQLEVSPEQRRIICQRITVRMVGELFKPEQSQNSRPPTLH
ncbi:MAG TPA: hypothetical protein VGH29_06170 [Candidatus Binataceae bacterium]|jgi:hypothetical protein